MPKAPLPQQHLCRQAGRPAWHPRPTQWLGPEGTRGAQAMLPWRLPLPCHMLPNEKAAQYRANCRFWGRDPES